VLVAGLAFGVCAVIATALFWSAERTAKDAPGRPARRHLQDLGRAWATLAIYYFVSLLFGMLVWGNEAGRRVLDEANPYPYFWFHTLAMVACTITNIILLRAIVQLDIPLPGPAASKLPNAALERQYPATAGAIALTGVASLVVLWIGGNVPAIQAKRLVIVLAYAPQMLISSGLFVWLAYTYRAVTRATPLFVATAAYGVLQLLYPWLHLYKESQLYGAALLGSKLVLALMTVSYAPRFRDRLADRGGAEDALHVAGVNQARLAATRRALRVWAGGVVALAFTCLAMMGYAWVVAWCEAERWERTGTIAVRVAFVPVLWLGGQALGYLTVRRFAHAVPWARMAAGELESRITCTPASDGVGCWRSLAVRPRVPQPGVREDEIVLVHGILSSGPCCWGLLPAMLAESPGVAAVHVLSYRHSLWSLGAHLDGLPRELAETLLRISGAQRDTLFSGVGPRDAEKRLVVMAHSLGALVMIRALADPDKGPRLRQAVRHLVCVGAPLAGSRWAFLGWPWAWPRALRVGSKFVVNTMEAYHEVLPQAGHRIGEGRGNCTVSFLHGTRDSVVGPIVRMFHLPGAEDTPGPHDLMKEVYVPGGEHAGRFVRELNRSSRDADRMRLVGANLAAGRVCITACVWECPTTEVNIGIAVVSEMIPTEHGMTVPSSRICDAAKHRPLLEVIAEAYARDIARRLEQGEDHPIEPWGTFEALLRRGAANAIEDGGLLQLPWQNDSTLYLISAGGAGVVIVVRERRMRLMPALRASGN
jgi:hypothetical protein